MVAKISDMFPALVECFTIILCGYIAGRTNIITPKQGMGLGKFVSNFALPALLFKSMVELDFSTVRWFFLIAVLLAKTTIFFLVFVMSLALLKTRKLARGSLYSIFATQSNDFALGYPLINALYGNTHQEFIQYIYLIAPISLLILNPIGFVVLEFEKNRSTESQEYILLQDKPCEKSHLYVGEDIDVIDEDHYSDSIIQDENREEHTTRFTVASCLAVLKGVLLNPLVFTVLLGLAGHFIFGGHLPPIIGDTLGTLSNAFAGAALFFLGLTMVGKISNQKGMELLLPVLLIITKVLLLPIIIRQYCNLFSRVVADSYPSQFHHNSTNASAYITSLSDFGYLYGTFPSAPTVVIYATKYGLEADRLAAGMVLCTTLSAPIMYISAWTLSMGTMSAEYFHDQVKIVGKDASIITLLCSVWCIIIFVIGGKFRQVPHAITLAYVFSLVLSSLGTISWDSFATETNFIGKLFLFGMLFFGVKCSRLYAAAIAITLVLILWKGQRVVWNHCCTFIAVPIVLAFVITVSLMTVGHMGDYTQDGVFLYGKAQDTVSLVVLLFCFLIVVACLIIIAKMHEHHDESLLSPSTNLLPISEYSSDDNDSPTFRKTVACCIRKRCVFGDIQRSRHIVLLVLSTLSIFLGICLVMWRMFNAADASVYYEVAFLDSVFNFGQGIFIFLLFGLDPDLIIDPFIRLYRKLRYGSESISLPELDSVDKSALLQCLQFIRHHLVDCKLDIVTSHRSGIATYESVFTGASLCDWVLDRGLVNDRAEAEIYGHNLLIGRVMRHVSNRHYFYDRNYLYQFEEPKTCRRINHATDDQSTVVPTNNGLETADTAGHSRDTINPAPTLNFASSPQMCQYFGFSFEAYLSDAERMPASLRRQRDEMRPSPRPDQQLGVAGKQAKARPKRNLKKVFPKGLKENEFSDSSLD